MAYIHEQRLQRAVAKLHMLGHSSRRQGKSGLEGFGESLGGMAMGGMNRPTPRAQPAPVAAPVEETAGSIGPVKLYADKPDKPTRAPDAYAEFLRMTGNDPGLKQEASKLAIQQLAKQARSQESVDKEAILNRMGGVHSPEGLELAEENSHLNAQDRLRARSLIGIGGTQAGGF